MEKNQISIQDFESLVELAEEIINEHFEMFEDTSTLFDLPTSGVKELAQFVHAGEDLREFVKELVLSKKEGDFEERIIKATKSLLRKHNVD